MDLPGDLSWKHSFRQMYLTFLTGCSAGETERAELSQRDEWLSRKRGEDAAFETTKLEWAKHLTAEDLLVLGDPVRYYGRVGAERLPRGARVVSLQELRQEVFAEYQSRAQEAKWSGRGTAKLLQEELAAERDRKLARLGREYPAERGFFVESRGGRFWRGGREAPEEEIRGLARLKGHVAQGQWLTKFRKTFRPGEMNDDLVFVSVAEEETDEYIRILPTSPP